MSSEMRKLFLWIVVVVDASMEEVNVNLVPDFEF